MALQGYLAKVSISGTAVAMTKEGTTATGNITYQISAAAKQVIGHDAAIAVYDGADLTTESYTVERLTGTIAFGSATARTITITSEYLPITQLAQANSWNINMSVDMLENTVFQATSKTYQAGLKGATGSLSKFNETTAFFHDLLLDGTLFVLALYIADAIDPIRCYCYLDSDNVNATVADLVTNDVTFTVTDNLVIEI